MQYVDEWFYQTADIVPEFILEDAKYNEEEYELIDEKRFYELYELYNGTNDIVRKIIKLIYRLGSAELYGRIQGHSESTMLYVGKVIQLCINENIKLPVITDYKKYSFNANNGWGEDFDGSRLSIILNNREV